MDALEFIIKALLKIIKALLKEGKLDQTSIELAVRVAGMFESLPRKMDAFNSIVEVLLKYEKNDSFLIELLKNLVDVYENEFLEKMFRRKYIKSMRSSFLMKKVC